MAAIELTTATNFTKTGILTALNAQNHLNWVAATSGNVASVNTALFNTSGSWNSTNTSVFNTSGRWNSVYTYVNNNSADFVSTETTVFNNSGNWSNTYTTVQANSSKWLVYQQLTFNSIPNFDVVGDGVIRNLGDTAGMTFVYTPGTDFYRGFTQREDASTWYFEVDLQLASQYGGVDIDIGLNVDYSSAAGSPPSVDYIGLAARSLRGSTTFEVHNRTFSFIIPKLHLGSPVDYIRFNVIARRNVLGNTGVYSGLIKFK